MKVVNRRSRPRPCRIEMGRRTDSRERQAPRREMTGNLGSNLGGLILWAAMPWPWGVSKEVVCGMDGASWDSLADHELGERLGGTEWRSRRGRSRSGS